MIITKRVYVYIDGSNFYHLLKLNYNTAQIDFAKIIDSLLNVGEEVKKIKYYNSPVNQQEEPQVYANQLKFFEKIKKNILLELNLGRLVKRKINKINVVCENCGLQIAENLKCPKCNKDISLNEVYKTTEKGLDVKIALDLLIDGLENKYDVAFLLSGDADFVPAIKYIKSNLNKEVIYCRFPKPRTEELINNCSSIRIIRKEFVHNAILKKFPKN